MAYSAIEQRYVNLLTTAAFPDAVDEPEPMAAAPSLEGVQLAAGPAQTRTDAPQGYGEIRAVPQTKLESALQSAGVTLEQIGRFVDGLGQVDVPGLGEVSLADLMPFVGSAKPGTRSVMGQPDWQGTPMALQAPAEGKPLVTGKGQTLQLSPDAKLAAFDALPAAQGVKTLAKGAKAAGKSLAPAAADVIEEGLRKSGFIMDAMDPADARAAADAWANPREFFKKLDEIQRKEERQRIDEMMRAALDNDQIYSKAKLDIERTIGRRLDADESERVKFFIQSGRAEKRKAK